MKRSATCLAAILALGASGLTGFAHAGVSIAGTGAVGGLAATDATALKVNRDGGPGHISLIPYYSTQGGNSTLINITNTDEVNGKAVAVRFRSALNADTVYSFTVLLRPGDVWATNISQGADGRSMLTTSDKTCTLPTSVSGSFVTDRLPFRDVSAMQQAEWTREGYVEVITMADVPPGSDLTGEGARPRNALLAAMNPAVGLTRCGADAEGAAALNALSNDPVSESTAQAAGLDTPTMGLMVSSVLINVFDASVAWTTPTTSITAVNAAGEPARGRLVFSPQTSAAAPNIDLYTNDPLLRTVAGGGAGKVMPNQYDLPDLSTPYLSMAANTTDFPFRHVESVSQALAVKSLRNDYLLEKNIAASTDWTISQPTRRFGFGVDYSTSPGTAVFNDSVAGPSRFSSEVDTVLPHSKPECTWVFLESPVFFDRKGGRIGGDRFDGPPGFYAWREICGAVSVLIFDGIPRSTSVLRAGFTQSVVVIDSMPTSFDAGWGYFETIGAAGRPLIGAAYIQARGPLVSGKSTNFGILYNHGTLR